MKLNHFIKLDFGCNNCKKEFRRDTAFSFAPNLEYLTNHVYPTYCFNCAITVEEQTSLKKTKKAPIRQQNRRKKTGRTHLFGTRATKE